MPGGVTEVPDTQKMVDFKFRLAELIAFIDNEYVPTVKAVAGDLSRIVQYRCGLQNMLSYGGLPLGKVHTDFVHQEKFFPSKVLLGGQL